MQMSCSESSSTNCPDVGNVCVGEERRDDSVDKTTKCVSNDCSSPDSNVRERVLKEVGLTSNTFIGPALPSETVKSDIDNKLSEFYKELEKVDIPDGASGNPGKQEGGFVHPPTTSKMSNAKDTQDVSQERIDKTSRSEETDGYEKSSGQRQASWPHWYQNEPYYSRRPGFEQSTGGAAFAQYRRHDPQPRNRTPNSGFHRPPFHHPAPPSEFPNLQIPPLHMNPNWDESGMPNQYEEDSHFPIFHSLPPPNVCRPPSQGFYGNPKHPFDRVGHGGSYSAQSKNVNTGWPRDREEEWPQLAEHYDRCQRFDSDNEQWEEQRHYQPRDNTHESPSSLVLILMRGLPGSGKSTLARELLSTSPSGLILSTDDYFAHRDGYCYEPGLLGKAHEWNQSRAKDGMHQGRSPIIIDNTNIQAWEMKPYVKMALESGYRVDFCEPDTSWKFDPYELERRNKHGVPQDKISQMLDRFSFPISIDIVMSSEDPPHVNQRHRPRQPQNMRKQYFH
uniref:NEDD4 binding protein 2-like 2 n=2 Tax=Anabas testudineus TaxID=64144 RepID=A0A7N6FCU3_ANATE